MPRKLTAFVIALLLMLGALPAFAEVYVASVDLNVNAMALMPGGSGRQLSAVISPANADNTRIYWMSSNESVATVDNNGYVTPRSLGSTIITAQTENGEEDTCTVIVTDNPVTTISISESTLTIPDRTAYVLTAEVAPMTAQNTDITWQTSDKKVAVVNQNGKIFAKSPGTCWISAIANGGVDVAARCLVTVTPSDAPMKYVALTFDDGPCDNTLEILKVLEEYDVHVTFFWLGQLIERYPNYVRKAHSRGHQIGNHSYSHETLTKISLEKAQKQMDDTDAALMSVIGMEAPVYRAPGGSVTEKIAKACGKPFIDWTVDTLDWKYRDPEHVWTFIAKNTGNYDVVLMHDIRPTTTEAIKKAVPYLLEQGFTLVTMTELLELTGWNDPSLIYAP